MGGKSQFARLQSREESMNSDFGQLKSEKNGIEDAFNQAILQVKSMEQHNQVKIILNFPIYMKYNVDFFSLFLPNQIDLHNESLNR